MFKKRYLILFFLIICVGVIIYLSSYISVKRVGTITINAKELESRNSVITFSGKKGEHIEVIFKSNVKEGEWNLQLVDTNRLVLYTFETDKSAKGNYQLPEDGQYGLVANCEDFIGKVRIKATLE